MVRIISVLFATSIICLASAQPITSIYLATFSNEARLDLPMIGYVDNSCRGEAEKWLGDWETSNLEHLLERVPAEDQPAIILDDHCVVFPDLSRAEASSATRAMLVAIENLKLGGLSRPGGWRSYVPVEESPAVDVVGVSVVVYAPGEEDASSDFGYIYFEYKPEARELRMHHHRYVTDENY